MVSDQAQMQREMRLYLYLIILYLRRTEYIVMSERIENDCVMSPYLKGQSLPHLWRIAAIHKNTLLRIFDITKNSSEWWLEIIPGLP